MFDFIGITSFYRAILFLAVGIIALVISFLYIHLEKKENEKKAAAEEVAEPEVTIVEEPEGAAVPDESTEMEEYIISEMNTAQAEEEENHE